jgi:hypothetical protein
MVDTLRASIKPVAGNSELAAIASNVAIDFTLLRVERPAETLEHVLAGISSHANVVVSFALRQLVIELGRQYGIDPEEPVGPLLGNEMALVKVAEDENAKFALLIEVKDKARLLPTLGRYLRKDGGRVRSEDYHGVEIVIGSSRDERSAAFLGSYLVLASHAQIVRIIDAWKSAVAASSDRSKADSKVDSRVDSIREIVKDRGEAVLISCRFDNQPAAELMLGLSRILRATDGSRELLKSERMQSVVAQLPPSVSATHVNGDGILIETRSPLGAFTMASGFFADPAGELRESQAAK